MDELKQPSAEELASARFEVPYAYGPNGMKMLGYRALGTLVTGSMAGLSAATSLFWSAPLAVMYGGLGITVWVLTGFWSRARELETGKPFTHFFGFSALAPFVANAGRTLTPEFARFQPILDRAWLDKQAKRPRLLRARHDKRDVRGRFTS